MAVPTEPELLTYIGPPLRQSFAQLLDEPGEADILRAIELYRERFSSKGMYECFSYPGISEALHKLKEAGRKIFVVTSKPHHYAIPIVENLGLEQLFEQVYGSELDGTRGDKTELIAHVLSELALAPEQAVMIGDRKYDVVGAHRNQVATIGVGWGYGSEQELTDAGCDHYSETLESLLEILL